MKQNDLIFSIVSVVLALIIAGVCYGTKRQVVAKPAPTPVVVTPPQLPTGEVKFGGGGAAAGGGIGGAPGGAPTRRYGKQMMGG